MNLPEIGQLKHRVKFEVLEHDPGDSFGFVAREARSFEVWGKLEVVGGGVFWGSKQVEDAVTHRIWVRRTPGKTDPASLKAVTELLVGNRRFRAKRIEDADGLERFTVLECEELGVV